MKICVGVNTLTQVDQLAYMNHCQFWFKLGRHYPDFNFILSSPRRMSIDTMRNMTAKVALENDCDYILFIDDDVLVPLDCLSHLLACNADIAAGWTIIRGYPYKNMFFRFTDESKLNLENYPDSLLEGKENIVPCDAVGFSCCLIKTSILKTIKKPYFVTGPHNTEDIYFCMKVLESNPESKIVVNTLCKTSHILGSELIDPLNRHLYKKYYEEMFPEVVGAPEPKFEAASEDPISQDGNGYEDILARAVFGSEKNESD